MRKAAWAEDGVQGRKAGGVDARGVAFRLRADIRDRQHCGRKRERPHHLSGGARRGRSPARSKGRKGRRHVRGEGRHQVLSIEHLFE